LLKKEANVLAAAHKLNYGVQACLFQRPKAQLKVRRLHAKSFSNGVVVNHSPEISAVKVDDSKEKDLDKEELLLAGLTYQWWEHTQCDSTESQLNTARNKTQKKQMAPTKTQKNQMNWAMTKKN